MKPKIVVNYVTPLKPEQINLALLIGVLKFTAKGKFPQTDKDVDEAIESGLEFVSRALPKAEKLSGVR